MAQEKREMSYSRFNGKSWNFQTMDWTFYQKMKALTGTTKEMNEERFRSLITALIEDAYENNVGGIRDAFFHACTRNRQWWIGTEPKENMNVNCNYVMDKRNTGVSICCKGSNLFTAMTFGNFGYTIKLIC